jgi:hypothetical protein
MDIPRHSYSADAWIYHDILTPRSGRLGHQRPRSRNSCFRYVCLENKTKADDHREIMRWYGCTEQVQILWLKNSKANQHAVFKLRGITVGVIWLL